MDTIFYNGIIHTLDKAYPEVSALAIKDGVISGEEEVRPCGGGDPGAEGPPDPPH